MTWSVTAGNCIAKMPLIVPSGSVDLVVTDPPYNISRNYDVYNDKVSLAQYLDFTNDWGREVKRVLKPHGSFWVAIYPNLVSEIDVLFKQLGFHKRGHIIWMFTFGMNNAFGFTRSHTHWLYYTNHRTKYTFNKDDQKLRHTSARQRIYGDKRANPKGRLPDDVWLLDLNIVKEELPKDLDVWIESRVCGTFHERAKETDNQLPLALCDRIIRASSNPGEMVVDPFTGSGSIGCSAVRLGRNYTGFELSKPYTAKAKARIAEAAKAGVGI